MHIKFDASFQNDVNLSGADTVMNEILQPCLSQIGQPGHDIFGTPSNDTFYHAFAYDEIDASKHDLRLLRVLLDHGGGLVECELQSKKPLNAITGKYSALSYCAGDPTKIQLVLINGIRFRVFANLAHALAEVRYFWKSKYGTREFLLWVDQICM